MPLTYVINCTKSNNYKTSVPTVDKTFLPALFSNNNAQVYNIRTYVCRVQQGGNECTNHQFTIIINPVVYAGGTD